MIYISVTIAIVGWIVGFASSTYGTYLLDKRRAFRSVIGEIEAVRADLHQTADFMGIHERGRESIKPLFFSAMTFLSADKQKEARQAWESYRALDLADLEPPDYESEVKRCLGRPEVTRDEALHVALDRLIAVFSSSPF